MKIMRFCSIILLAVAGLISVATAQSKNELGLLLGATIVPDQNVVSGLPFTDNTLKFSKGIAYQATYARRIFDAGIGGIDFELPFIGIPNADITSGNPNPPTALASLFITPGVRLKLLPGSGISPWVSVGGGLARFDEGSNLVSGAPNTSQIGTNRGVVQFGAGIDFKLLPHVSLRGEVRDFLSGKPVLNVDTENSRQNNIVASGGFVLHF